jgi:hypothetical protein
MAFQLNISADWAPYISIGQGDPGLAQNNRSGNGYARYTPTTAKQLSTTPAAGAALPNDARSAWIYVLTNPVRVRTDGTNPTASEGFYIAAGSLIIVENQREFLRQLRFIDTAAGASEVTVQYFA